MVKVYCDVCKNEVSENFAGIKARAGFYDNESHLNLYAEITFSGPTRCDHICKACAVRILHEGAGTLRRLN